MYYFALMSLLQNIQGFHDLTRGTFGTNNRNCIRFIFPGNISLHVNKRSIFFKSFRHWV